MSNPTIQFTPAQAAAIRARGGSLLVSAAAGSGKTRVLVERAVGLITDPVHPVEADSLLIMTFTNAAAAKLRADITARLLAEVRRHPGDSRLRRQQLRLQRASIGTVDAFCLHFVQQHFAALDIPPDFETADDATLGRLRQDTLISALSPICMTGAAPTTPPGRWCWNSTTLPAPCPTRIGRWTTSPPCGRGSSLPRTPCGARHC